MTSATFLVLEKKNHKSGSLKRKERQEAKRQESVRQCRSIVDFMQPPTTSMPSLATNNQEAKNHSNGMMMQ